MIYNSFALLGEYISMAWVAIKSNKLRSFLTTLGIFIGVTTIITIWTTIQGLNSYIHTTFAEIGSAKVYVEKFPWIITDNYWKYRNRENITWREYEAIDRYSTLAEFTTPQIVSRKTVGFRETKFENVPILGTTETFIEMTDIGPSEGRIFTELDVRNKVRVCVLGSELAVQLFDDKSPVGTRIKIDGLKLRFLKLLIKLSTFSSSKLFVGSSKINNFGFNKYIIYECTQVSGPQLSNAPDSLCLGIDRFSHMTQRCFKHPVYI